MPCAHKLYWIFSDVCGKQPLCETAWYYPTDGKCAPIASSLLEILFAALGSVTPSAG